MAVTTWDEAAWNQHYKCRIRDPADPQFGQTLGYTRKSMGRFVNPYTDDLDLYEGRWTRLKASFPGMDPADRFLVAGCGFGFLIEVAHDDGYPNVWGIDSSPYISNNRATEARGDVLLVEDDIRGGGRVRTALRNLTGDDTFDWVISEDVLTCYDVGTDMDQMLNAAETALAKGRPLNNVIHMVTESPLQLPFTGLTLEEWDAIRPAHSWVSIRFSQWRVL
jgi:SAM-dependent methyltransferase